PRARRARPSVEGRAAGRRLVPHRHPPGRRSGRFMTGEARGRLRDAVLEALRMVIDPELGESLVDLGLIYGIDVDEQGGVRIAMSTTTRGCPATAYLKDAVHSAASFVPGVEGVDV